MSRCLSARALARLYADAGTRGQRTHLEACQACRARYSEIGRDLAVVATVLLRTSEPEPSHGRRVRFWLPALGAAATAATVAIAIWTTSGLRTQTSPPRSSVVRSDDSVVVSTAPPSAAESLRPHDARIGEQLQELEAAAMFETWCDGVDIEGTPECDVKSLAQRTNSWESDLDS